MKKLFLITVGRFYKAIPYLIIVIFVIAQTMAATGADPVPPTVPAPTTISPETAVNQVLDKLREGSPFWVTIIDTVMMTPAELTGYIYNIIFPIGIAIGIFGIVMSGYTFLTSEGRPDKVKDASEKLTSAIIGLLFIILSIVILRLIMKSFIMGSVNF